jgi:hypothetical protein
MRAEISPLSTSARVLTSLLITFLLISVLLILILISTGCGSSLQPFGVPAAAAHPAAPDSRADNQAEPASSDFTVSLSPASLTIAPGKSGSTKVTTKISTGFDHKLTLNATGLPGGVTIKFTPATIPAPGAGTSTAEVSVSSAAATGTHSITIKAYDGSTTSDATLTLKIAAASGPGATFQGCWYKTGGSSYQGVQVGVANPGTYPFDADLYYGTVCDKSTQADEFGFGQEIKFGGFDYIFWFDAFADQKNMSALWHVGSDTSACVNYEVAPDCN